MSIGAVLPLPGGPRENARPADTRSAIDAEAAAWVVREEGAPLDEEGRRILADWARRSPAHEASLSHARACWAALGRLHPHAAETRTGVTGAT